MKNINIKNHIFKIYLGDKLFQCEKCLCFILYTKCFINQYKFSANFNSLYGEGMNYDMLQSKMLTCDEVTIKNIIE